MTSHHHAHGTAWSRIVEEVQHWRRRDWSFDAVGQHWDSTEDYDDINEETYSYYRRFIDGFRLCGLPEDSYVLDFCARTGNGTLHFQERGAVASAVCADVSPRMGEICQHRLRDAGFTDFRWHLIRDYRFPFTDDEFDAVLCFETIEHFDDPERLTSELARVTRPGGTVLITTPNVLWEPVHALAAVTGLHHSEGPHRFVPLRRLKKAIQAAQLSIRTIETTVLVPGGPPTLIRMGEWIEQHTRRSLMPLLGLRRIIVCDKPEMAGTA